MFSHESDILRKLRLIEGLKAELVTNVGQLYQAMAQNSEQAIKEGIAGIVVLCYVLARRLGIDFGALDEAVLTRADRYIKREHEAEQWFGDFSEYRRHLRHKE